MNRDKYFFKRLIQLCGGALLLHFFSVQGIAQVADLSPSPAAAASPSPSPGLVTRTIGHDESPPIEYTVPHVRYFFPDLADNVTTLETRLFKFRVGFAMLPDLHVCKSGCAE
jgi:hypothetical protein